MVVLVTSSLNASSIFLIAFGVVVLGIVAGLTIMGKNAWQKSSIVYLR